MSIQSILAVVAGHEEERGALEAVLSIAQASQATVRLLHISPPPPLPETTGLEMAGTGYYAGEEALEVLDRETVALKTKAEELTRDACRHHAVPLREADIIIGRAQAFWRHVVGTSRDCIPTEALTTDLVATNYIGGPRADLEVILAALFSGGRPVLAIPGHYAAVRLAEGYARTVVFAWDGSRASASALREAVPHMLHAVDVLILHIRSRSKAIPDCVTADLRAYLRSHGVCAEFVVIERGDSPCGECLLEEARGLNADLLVMGAYGHGHISEMLLGGTTDHVLKHTDIPVLLAR